MNAPAAIAASARARIREAQAEIRRSVAAIASGRPGDAEPDKVRLADVVQARNNLTLSEARDVAPVAGPEAIWGDTVDFVDAVFLERGSIAARAVCRIATSRGQGIGTGFLISSRLLITNNHVIGTKQVASGFVAEFDYELDLSGVPRPVTRYSLAPEILFVTDDQDDLDFTIVALGRRIAGEKDLQDFGSLPLSAAGNKHALGDIVNIIQHPDGRLKEAVVRENQIVSRPKGGTVLHYVADTEPGSSGSPVFNLLWGVVALHHWGGPHKELFDEKGVRVPRTVNEGIRISAIVSDLTTRKDSVTGSGRALLEEALKLGIDATPLPSESTSKISSLGRTNNYASQGVTMSDDGTATWQIPVTISVSVGGTPSRAREPLATPTIEPPNVPVAGEAKLILDENYDDRGGYDPQFLGVNVPMPALSADQKRIAAKNQEAKRGGDAHELKYEHFSLVMNGERRLAFFTATNIDGAHAKDVDRDTGVISDSSGISDGEDDEGGSEGAEKWFTDRRIRDEQQTPWDFYLNQKTFDANGKLIKDRRSGDHRNRMFQQGHLTRRQDPLWGNDEVVIRAHADTFHVTNRAPQVGYFNMGIRKAEAAAEAAAKKKHAGGQLYWRALEDYVLENARADRKRVTVFTGPIFGAQDIPWSRGWPDMKGFKAPREFWKLVLRVDGGKLQATALVIDQSKLIDFVPEVLDLSLEEARRVEFSKVEKYQVTIAELSHTTGLSFGADVENADTFQSGGRGESRRKRVETLADLTLGKPASPKVAKKNAAKKRSRTKKAANRK